jgi:hypothetical protein
MQDQRDENERALADAVSRVREFVVQQVQTGQRADALSFALTFIATEMGLHVTHGRNPLGVVRTALQGVIAAAEAFTVDGQADASSETGAAPTLATDAVPKGTVIH